MKARTTISKAFLTLICLYFFSYLILRVTLTQYTGCNDYTFGVTHDTITAVNKGHLSSYHSQLRTAAYLTALYYPLILVDERITGADFTRPSEILIHL